MKKFKSIGVLFMLSWLLSACASHNVEQYKNEGPKLDLQTYLNGRLTGEGMVQDWRGRVATRFSFDACATWQGDTLTLDEHMEYYNGKKDHRIWTLKKVDEHNYIGTTPEVIGEAKITVDGNAMNWKYTMDVDVDGSTYRLNFDDWMFLMKNDVLINVNQFSKFGFNVGSLTLFMQKQEGDTCQDPQ